MGLGHKMCISSEIKRSEDLAGSDCFVNVCALLLADESRQTENPQEMLTVRSSYCLMD